MARKSREAILRESLLSISDCPFDIFDVLEPSDVLFKKIERAENADEDALTELIQTLFELSADTVCDSLIYFLRIGCEMGNALSADRLIECIAKRGYSPMLFPLADGVASGRDSQTALDAECEKEALLLYCIAAAAEAKDKDEVRRLLASISFSADCERLYLYSCLLRLGEDAYSEAEALATRLGMGEILRLKSFSCQEAESPAFNSGLCKQIYNVAMEHKLDIWRDFWLRCAYEHVIACGESLLNILDMAIEFVLLRKYSERKNLYALALYKYGCDNAPSDKKACYLQAYADYKRLCLFEEWDVESELASGGLISEAVYLDSEAEKNKILKKRALGDPILHTKNRYILSSALTNHIKRGKKHLWHTTLSFPLDKSEALPVFSTFTVTEARPIITRGGISLPQSKTACQVICYCEISLGGVNHPFTLDLILDISYVSATKCAGGDITVKRVSRTGESFVLSADIALY